MIYRLYFQLPLLLFGIFAAGCAFKTISVWVAEVNGFIKTERMRQYLDGERARP